MKPAVFERSRDTEAVIDALRGVNREISYKVLASQAKLTEARLREVLGSARRILLKDQIVFEAVYGEGLVRLDDHDKVLLPIRRKRRIHRQCSLGLKELETIQDFSSLTNIEQLKVTTDRTILSLTRQQTQAERKPRAAKAAPLPQPDAASYRPGNIRPPKRAQVAPPPLPDRAAYRAR